MAIAYISGTVNYDADDDVQTASIDTSGANLLVVMYATFVGYPSAVSDSKSNTWTELTHVTLAGVLEMRCAYVAGSPTVGSGHTFSVNTTDFSTIMGVFAFSGASATPATNNMVGAAAAQPGSLTPPADNAVLCAFLYDGSGPYSIDSGFTEVGEDGLTASAYKIQTTAGAENPTWSGGTTYYTSQLSFAAALVASQTPFTRSSQYQPLLAQ